MLCVQQDGRDDGCAVLRPEGELDAFTVSTFRYALVDASRAGALIIDLSEVSFLDSAGLCALVGGIRHARETTTPVVVACPRYAVKKALVAAGVDRLVALADTLEEAALAVRKQP